MDAHRGNDAVGRAVAGEGDATDGVVAVDVGIRHLAQLTLRGQVLRAVGRYLCRGVATVGDAVGLGEVVGDGLRLESFVEWIVKSQPVFVACQRVVVVALHLQVGQTLGEEAQLVDIAAEVADGVHSAGIAEGDVVGSERLLRPCHLSVAEDGVSLGCSVGLADNHPRVLVGMRVGKGEVAPRVGGYVEVRPLVAAHPSPHLIGILLGVVPQSDGEDVEDVKGDVVFLGVAHLCRHGVEVHLHGEVVGEEVFHLVVVGIVGQSGTVALQAEGVHAVGIGAAVAVLLSEHHLHAFYSRSRAVGDAAAHHTCRIGKAVGLHR